MQATNTSPAEDDKLSVENLSFEEVISLRSRGEVETKSVEEIQPKETEEEEVEIEVEETLRRRKNPRRRKNLLLT
jgi:hypothetical protein